MFAVTFKDQFGFKKCVYGDSEYGIGETIPEKPECYCNEKGVVICDTPTEAKNTLESAKYINEGLNFSSSFLNFIDSSTSSLNVRFGEVSSINNGLEIVVERFSMCNATEELPPQIGYYMFSGSDLYLTTSTNLLAGNYGKECMVSNRFIIDNNQSVSKIFYQSEGMEVFSADICVFDGKVDKAGDAFVGESGEVVVCE